MKRLLSITAMLALVISLFSGVSFAAAVVGAEIVLDQEVVVVDMSNGGELIQVKGRIADVNGSTVTTANTFVRINGITVQDTAVTNGTFTIYLFSGAIINAGVGNYHVTADGVSGGDEDNVRFVPDVRLDSGYSIDFEFPVADTVIISGDLPNADGDYYDIAFGYVSTTTGYSMGTQIAELDIYGNDSFGGLFGGSAMTQAGEVGLFVRPDSSSAYVLVMSGEVSPAALAVTVSPSSVPRNIGSQTITFDFNMDSDYTDGSRLETGYSVYIAVTKPGSTSTSVTDTILDDGSINIFDNRTTQQVDFELACDSWNEGTADIKVELRYLGNVIKDADLEIEISDPNDFTLVGWSLETASVGTLKLALPSSGGSYLSPNNQEVHVIGFNDNNDSSWDVDFYEIVAEGCGVDETFTNYVAGGSAVSTTVPITTTETGTLDITINVYSDASDTTPDETFTREVAITGFNVSFMPKTIEVDTAPDFVIDVSNEDGVEVNNAKIYIGTQRIVDGNDVSIIGGTYVYEDDDYNLFESVGFLTLRVTGYNNGTYTEVIIEDAIEVVGKTDYTVEANIDSLVNGTQEVFYIEVTDSAAGMVYPSFTRINVDEDGNRTVGATIYTGTYTDLDGDGIRESVKITLTPTYNQTELIIRATTDSGKKIGEITLPVNPPAMSMNGAATATENIYAYFDFTILDPRDDGLLDGDIYLVADDEYIDYRIEDIGMSNGKSSDIRANSNDEYLFRVFVNDVDWDALADDEEEAVISLYYESGVDDIKLMEIPIKEASLTSDPEVLLVGTGAPIVFTYLDGDGNPLEGFMIMENDVELGETGENGTLYHTAIAGSAIQLTYEAETNDHDDTDSAITNTANEETIYTKLVIRPGIDTEGPVASAPTTTASTSVMVTIEDPSGVARYMINGERYEPFFPAPKVVEFVTLQPGLNTLLVVGVDSKGYMGTTTLTVMSTAGVVVTPPAGTVTFTVGEATPYGTPELIGGTTMVPVRFAEDLGATMAWNNQTKTATYTLGSKTVSVTIGNKTAMVNGEAVMMAQAPFFNAAGRTMVPLRMIAQELGFSVNWVGNNQPISIVPMS